MSTEKQPPANSVTRINPSALASTLQAFRDQHPGVLQPMHDTMFSETAICISHAHLAQMKSVIAAVETLVSLPTWQARVLGETRENYLPANPGVFFGYDFHLNADGAHLIEINTNAGGGFLSALFERSQLVAGLPGITVGAANPEQAFVDMFRREWELQRGRVPLQSVAIVDENPQAQYFYPEFVLARDAFERAGIRAFIADPSELKSGVDGVYLGDTHIGLVYNRLTDFSLAQFPLLLNDYKHNLLVLTPHPHAYQLYADKRNLALLSDEAFLRSTGLDESNLSALLEGVPQTVLIESRDEKSWWAERKDWFFKPATGFGGRGSYRGDKLTRGVFEEIVHGGYVAQRKAMPGEVMVQVGEAEAAAFKYDVRCYVYEGEIQLMVARMYQGQTTNFRTPGGGFALVRVLN